MFTGRGKQLTVYVTETDKADHQPLYTAIIQLLRREGCVGATVTRGVAGFGSSAVIHTSQILVLSMDMPMIISVVDRPERIDRVLEPLKALAPNALITVQEVEVVQSGARFKEGPVTLMCRPS